jgi:hypothetical protein
VKVNQPGVGAFAARHSNATELDVVLTNESPNRTATVRLGTGSAAYEVTDSYTVAGNSGRIQHGQPNGATVQLSPYSVTLVRLKER